jgi:hypothetical protein
LLSAFSSHASCVVWAKIAAIECEQVNNYNHCFFKYQPLTIVLFFVNTVGRPVGPWYRFGLRYHPGPSTCRNIQPAQSNSQAYSPQHISYLPPYSSPPPPPANYSSSPFLIGDLNNANAYYTTQSGNFYAQNNVPQYASANSALTNYPQSLSVDPVPPSGTYLPNIAPPNYDDIVNQYNRSNDSHMIDKK